ncbi:hypothetical protein [Hymenobacter negativus]|uniref:Uncharacterized protein n=1 Tax=Hymenobacter negativus TaxID=2795026 RepID=A0ABS3QDJ4_9BACT|nr:hypothetical protein [Hymenobacter negativus]MBO2009078.1 hypothetical protein [Hymenobacter negativus]
MAVILKGTHFLISNAEVHDPSAKSGDLEEYDIEELHHASTLLEVEKLLQQKLAIALDELGPAKGIRRFISE